MEPAQPVETEGAASSVVPGRMIGRYKLLQRVGEGSSGSVWMVEQKEPVKRRVALKIIKLGAEHRRTQNVVQYAVELYELWEKPRQAARWKA